MPLLKGNVCEYLCYLAFGINNIKSASTVGAFLNNLFMVIFLLHSAFILL